MSERREGWYWVKFSAHPDDKWTPLEYSSLGFKITETCHVEENWFYMTGPRIANPDENP